MLFSVRVVPPVEIQLSVSLQVTPIWEGTEQIDRLKLWSDLVAAEAAGNVWEIQYQ